ncbi:hypothetical protein D3C87_1547340 [compost metagenome]
MIDGSAVYPHHAQIGVLNDFLAVIPVADQPGCVTHHLFVMAPEQRPEPVIERIRHHRALVSELQCGGHGHTFSGTYCVTSWSAGGLAGGVR